MPWLALAGVLVLSAGVVRWLAPDRAPGPPIGIHAGTRLAPDVGGPIRLAVTSLNSARGSTLRNAALVTSIVNTLSPRTRILMLVSDRDAFTVASDPLPGRARFVSMPVDTPITIWPQDPFLVLAGGDGERRLLVSKVFERAGDREMAAVLGAELGWPVSESGLSFDGGNVVADGERAFVGADAIARNARDLGLDDAQIARRFEGELGRPVVVIGPTPQPIGHIDMMLTPLGAGRIALADTAAGARIAAAQLASAPETVTAFEEGVEREFFGHPSLREIRTPSGSVVRAPEIRGHTADAIADSRLVAPVLDRIAEALAARGYDVVRIPLLLMYGLESAAGDPRSGPERPFADVLPYPMLTYNNVVVERAGGTDRVYLPRYGWPAFDRAAAERWRSIGYEVHAVPGFATSALYGGALRCTLKVLERDDAGS